MKDIKQIQEENRKLILEAIHGRGYSYEEALEQEMTFGCLIENHRIPNVIGHGIEDVFVDYCNDKEYRVLGYTGKLPIENIKKIIGKPITLSRVLLALGNKALFSDGDLCEYLITNDGLIMTMSYNTWDLSKETLEQQSEETQRAVWELLTGNE